MATYSGVGRTNTFQVKDVAKLTAALEFTGVEILEREDKGVTLFADPCGDGDWSIWVFDTEDEDDEGRYLYIPDLIAEHLMPGETVVFEHIGFEKLRYLIGYSTAVFSDGRQVTVNLCDVYPAAAAAFGIDAETITAAAC